MARVDIQALVDVPASAYLRGGAEVSAGHICASLTDSPWLYERSALARSEFHGAPRKCADAGCPARSEGSRTVGPPSLWYLSLGGKRKVLAAWRLPAPAFNKSMQLKMSMRFECLTRVSEVGS